MKNLISIYDEVNCGENCDCPISSPVGICQDSPNEGSKVASALPSGNISCSRDISFV